MHDCIALSVLHMSRWALCQMDIINENGEKKKKKMVKIETGLDFIKNFL